MSESQTPSIFEQLGDGEQAMAHVRRITKRFYEIMDTHPEVIELRRIHPEDLSSSEEKLYEFLVGWLGGPPLFTQKYGHPRLRARHMPFKIGEKERDQWLFCMAKALEENPMPPDAHRSVGYSLARLADHMRNQAENV